MRRVRTAVTADWDMFFRLADAERWRVPAVERRLFAGPWQASALALVDDRDCCGLVTAVAHERSGWIGNLIVPPLLRGHGYGALLFTAALASLERCGLASVWLTASPLGQPIYEKSGFRVVDEIERWVLHMPAGAAGNRTSATADADMLHACDMAAWGEERTLLLEALEDTGRVFAVGDTVALLQQEPGLQVIGPWYSPSACPRANRRLLEQLVAAAAPGGDLIVDLLASSPVRPLLDAAGFGNTGRNALMVRGEGDTADLSMMVSLASLGSVG